MAGIDNLMGSSALCGMSRERLPGKRTEVARTDSRFGRLSSNVLPHMKRKPWISHIVILLILLVMPIGSSEARGGEGREFDLKVAPILARRCLDCHSGSDPKGKLDLSSRTAALRGGESGTAIVAGKPDDSALWERVGSDEMPPKSPLSESEKGRAARLDRDRCGLGHRSDRCVSIHHIASRGPRLVVASAGPSAESARREKRGLGSWADRRIRTSEAERSTGSRPDRRPIAGCSFAG